MENSLEGPQKVKNGTALQSSNFTSENMSEETRNTNLKEYMHLYVQFSIILNGQDLKQPKCPSVDEWIKTLWYIYTMEYYVPIKKKEILPFQEHGWTWRALC